MQTRNAQMKAPRQIPVPASIARRGPSTAAVRNTSAVSRPGVRVMTPVATVKAMRVCVVVIAS